MAAKATAGGGKGGGRQALAMPRRLVDRRGRSWGITAYHSRHVHCSEIPSRIRVLWGRLGPALSNHWRGSST